MPYRPGDNWIICDLTGKKVLMSQSRKTWDGLRVWEAVWYPRHPQLDLRAIPDRMAVYDGRPRPSIIYTVYPFGMGAFCLISPNGTAWTFYVDDDGALLPSNEVFGSPAPFLQLGAYHLTVDDDGALHVSQVGSLGTTVNWNMRSENGYAFVMTVVPVDLALRVISV